ncbi:hypothetical protein BDN70DRAFT_871374 [Pholiota conissans]|uniref:Endopolyphosphatase n=1 Tax=Pholiota conissans TaxID=109636 RepID=A0A9P6CYJ9_9AGAR|nr:hypothetical protein BDN70DRAFT_871374 [Pholiota conissans]
MLFFPSLLFLAAGLAVDDVIALPSQKPLAIEPLRPKKLHGRFLHITDIHPDPHYVQKASESTACHRRKSKKKKNISLYYGTPYSECDSPFALTNFTLDYLKESWADEIDFVIWTGDNARHDNDRQIPRTPSEIYDLNRSIATKMHKLFSSRGIHVVPSLGNNDIWPHNILSPGPNSITNEFAQIWSQFIPFPYLQVFQRGAYYTVEVVPDQLAAISLNTMYFYDSNKVVSGCPFTDPNDPGNLQIDWMEVQLEMYRKRGMQVWITGHVPPSASNYFPECYVRYAELSLRYQDTIVGHLFGHMNVDHFFLLDAGDLNAFPKLDSKKGGSGNSKIRGEGTFYDALLEEFSSLPKSPKMTDYAAVNVAPSVVPNPYLPAFRIFSYNITGASNGAPPMVTQRRKHGEHRNDRNNSASCEHPDYQKTWRCHLDQPWHSDENSPSRTNQLWTPLGYAQFFIPALDEASKNKPPRFELEYMTYPLDLLHPETTEGAEGEFVYPVPLAYLPEPLRTPGSKKSKFAPYEMRDLTIPSWIRLARQIADGERRKLRKRFLKYMYLGGEAE